MVVWLTELFIFYFISQSFGEGWTHESYLLIAGMLILIYSTSVYNAPNAGSILLDGHWYSFGIDCSQEYEAVQREKGKTYAKSKCFEHENTSSTLYSSTGSGDLYSSLLENDRMH